MTNPTPKAAGTGPDVVLVPSWLCLLLFSLRLLWSLSSLHPAVDPLACTARLSAVLKSNRISAAANTAAIPRNWLYGVYTPKSAYESLLLFKPIHHSTAYTAVVWWDCLDGSVRTAITAVFQFSRYFLGILRAVFTTANAISSDIVDIEVRPPLPPIFIPPDADA